MSFLFYNFSEVVLSQCHVAVHSNPIELIEKMRRHKERGRQDRMVREAERREVQTQKEGKPS